MRGTLRSGNTEPGSIVVDNVVPIDLRHRPTRAELGIRPGRNERSYQQEPGGPELDVVVELPTGTVRVPAFVVTVSGDDDTPAGRANPREPQLILVERLCADPAAALAALAQDAPVLGLTDPDLTGFAGRLTATGPIGPRQDDRHALVADWLSVEIGVIGREDGRVQVNYRFGIDRFHHPALDRVVRDGVFAIDLTRPPTRADLGFRDTHSVSAIRPEPGADLIARVTLPGGVLHRPVAAVRSTTTGPDRAADSSGTGEPARTDLSLPTTRVAEAERILVADAAVLGLDLGSVVAAFAGEPAARKTVTLSGLHTAVCEVTVAVDADLARTDNFAAALTYTFRYPRFGDRS